MRVIRTSEGERRRIMNRKDDNIKGDTPFTSV